MRKIGSKRTRASRVGESRSKLLFLRVYLLHETEVAEHLGAAYVCGNFRKLPVPLNVPSPSNNNPRHGWQRIRSSIQLHFVVHRLADRHQNARVPEMKKTWIIGTPVRVAVRLVFTLSFVAFLVRLGIAIAVAMHNHAKWVWFVILPFYAVSWLVSEPLVRSLCRVMGIIRPDHR